MEAVLARKIIMYAAMVVALGGSAAAQETRSFNKLVADGYEIKATMMVPLETAAQVNSSVNYPTVVITLQKQKSTAVCYFGLNNYLLLFPGQTDAESACKVH